MCLVINKICKYKKYICNVYVYVLHCKIGGIYTE